MSDNTASVRAKDKAETKRTSSRKSSKAGEASLNMAELRELAELVNEHGFTDFEFENENIRVRLSKMTAAPVVHTVHQAGTHAPAAPAVSHKPEAAEAAAPAADPDEGLHKITSPIVGTFYRAPGPDKDPFVKEGTMVNPDTTVCIVEAMKLMNEIQAEVSGEVVRVYVENGQPVEYGQPLFGIRK